MAQQTTTDLQPTDGHPLVTGQGRTSIADPVVEKIADMAAREVSGVHEMGRGAARAFGSMKDTSTAGDRHFISHDCRDNLSLRRHSSVRRPCARGPAAPRAGRTSA